MQLSVMTWNILDGGRGREALIGEVLRDVGADVALLQEVASPALVQGYAERLGMAWFFAPGNRRGRHLAVLSRFALQGCYSFHPFPLGRALLEATIEPAPGSPVALFGVHLVPLLGRAMEAWREAEVQRILARVARCPTTRFLMAGDFNAIAPGDGVDWQTFPTWLKLAVRAQGGGISHGAIAQVRAAGLVDCFRAADPAASGFTLPTPHPNSRLDYIFASPALAVALRRCEILIAPLADRASDHYPVLAEFEL